MGNQEKRGSWSNGYHQGRNADNPERAEGIVRELIKTARTVSRRGYGTTQLIFSDWSFVSLTDSDLLGEVVALLRAAHKPLGFVAPDRDRKRNPFVESWEMGDSAALGELRCLAHSIYWHLLPERNAQQNAVADENERRP